MKLFWTVLALVCLWGAWITCNAQTLAAFPGAEGFGAMSVGGRGGRVIFVDNLNRSGAGSLKAACEDSTGARYIVFRVGGQCSLGTEIRITNPYITIAGETSPGTGFSLRGSGISVRTHNVIIRGLRFHTGDDVNSDDPSNRDCIDFRGLTAVHDVIVDHCSFLWGIDGNILGWHDTYNITLQWNMIAEPLNNSLHPKGGHSDAILMDSVDLYSVHHNIISNFKARGPQFAGDARVEFTNNVIHNGTNAMSEVQARADVHAWGNVYSDGSNPGSPKEVTISNTYAEGPELFVFHNIGPSRPTDTGTEWDVVTGSTTYQRTQPLANITDATRRVTQFPVSNSVTKEKVLNWAGASPWRRDAVEDTVVSQIRAGTGSTRDCVSQGVTIYWPLGTLASPYATSTTAHFAAPSGGVTTNRYQGKVIEITAGKGVGQTRTITASTVGPTVQVTVAAWDAGQTPDITSSYRIHNPCTSNYTLGYPAYTAGTPYTDTDGDGIPNYYESILTGGASTTTATVNGDLDGDGYENIEEWFHSFYHDQSARLVVR